VPDTGNILFTGNAGLQTQSILVKDVKHSAIHPKPQRWFYIQTARQVHVMRRRCTLQITLVLIGTLAVAGCGNKEQRHVYTNKQDCLDDWNNDPKSCEEIPPNNPNYRSNAHYFFGPMFRSGTTFSSGQGSRSIRTMSVSRGGFGSLAGFHSSGGS
jgi:uncharacterized protein YgiB involved in biofilm formation